MLRRGAWGAVRAVNTFTTNAMGIGYAGLARITGGDCRDVDGLRVCFEGRVPLRRRGGTTIGSTFVTKRDGWDRLTGDRRDAVIGHEKYHRDRHWRRFGPAFAVMYLWQEMVSGGGPHNKYEQQADKYGGCTGYLKRLGRSDECR